MKIEPRNGASENDGSRGDQSWIKSSAPGPRWRGRLILGGELHEVGPFDAVYIAPHVVHQLMTVGEEPFGFLCTVDDERDEPVQLEGRALAEYLARHPHLAGVVRAAGDRQE